MVPHSEGFNTSISCEAKVNSPGSDWVDNTIFGILVVKLAWALGTTQTWLIIAAISTAVAPQGKRRKRTIMNFAGLIISFPLALAFVEPPQCKVRSH